MNVYRDDKFVETAERSRLRGGSKGNALKIPALHTID